MGRGTKGLISLPAKGRDHYDVEAHLPRVFAVPTAKIVQTGRYQSVELPEGFQLATTTVSVSREGERIILSPLKTTQTRIDDAVSEGQPITPEAEDTKLGDALPPDWEWLATVVGPLDEDFEAAASTRAIRQQRQDLDAFD